MKNRHYQRGSTMAETGFVITALLTVMFGIIDFGRALYTYSFVSQLARQGARWGIVRGVDCAYVDHCNASQSDIQTYVQSLSEGATTASSFTVHANWGTTACNTSHTPGCTLTVTVSYPFSFMLPYLPSPSLTFSSSSSMLVAD